MPMDKDYILALNRLLFNTFRDKYIKAAFDQIKEDVRNAETLPAGRKELAKFAQKLVYDAFNEDFMLRLTAHVTRALRTAPPITSITAKINRWEAALKCIAKAYGWSNMVKIWAATRGFGLSNSDKITAKYRKIGSVTESELAISFKVLKEAEGLDEEFLNYIKSAIKNQR